jgi:hypothetical protein
MARDTLGANLKAWHASRSASDIAGGFPFGAHGLPRIFGIIVGETQWIKLFIRILAWMMRNKDDFSGIDVKDSNILFGHVCLG